ncbi:hemagglutinin repeat-containing protein [Pseudoduganella sp. R-31]|uniref:hemagglutinin repeat-containing protein n=1 Tax=Pseudoduganella sp. R-31 TaxID=3404060 RepID=UPI003CEDACB1
MAGRGDTLIKASTVLADKDLSIDAKGGLRIVSAEEASKSASTREEKKSGFSVSFKSGNLSTGYGKSNTSSQSSQETVTQHASSIGSLDGSVKLKSGETLQVVASDIASKENLTLIGKNVDLAAAQNTMQSQVNTQGKSSGFGVGFTVNPLAAFKDAYKTSTENSKSGSFVGKEFAKAEGAAEGAAAALAVVNTQFGTKKTNSTQNHATSEARTSSLLAGKDLTILATDGSITSQGAQISAEGNALILAKDSIKFDVAHNTESRSQDSKKSGFSIDTRSTQVIGSLNNNGKGNGATDTVTGTKLSVGGSTTMATQTGDIALTGASVVSEGNLSINAARDLTITSAQDTLHNANQSNNKAIGKVAISDTERFSGYHNEKHKDNSDQVTQVASNVSSLNGDVNLTAGQKYTQASSNVLAGNDVNITAKSIDITALQNTGSHQESNSDLKIGTFARISSPLIDLANNVEAARKSDGRLKEMQRMAATANAYQAASAINSMTGGAGSGILVKGEAGIGFASSSNSSNGNDSTAQGSTINGGRNVSLTATGGDIHATGATLNAGKTLSLDAAQNIVLDASQSTLHSDGKNKSSGLEAGVGFQVGAQTGVYVYAAANMGKGHNKNDSTINNNTELKADTINIRSKGDTTLKGATATANTINTDVGGKLAVESLQDTSAFDSKQSNVGVRVQVAIGNAWSASGNVSQQNGKGTYAGVEQQSGLFAGDGGYHVKADTIDLKGGAIASTNAAASELTTNKLTTSNIENKMTYSASNVSVAGGTGGGSKLLRGEDGKILPVSQQTQAFGTAKDGNVAPGLPMVEKGSDRSTTYATVTDGKITIGGVTTNSVKDLGINTDASKANTALDKLPDLQKLLKDQQAMSAATGTVIATGKQIAGDIAIGAAKAQKDAEETLKKPNITAEQRAEAEKTIDAAKQVQAEWGVGGDKSRALNVVTGILVGSVAGQSVTQIAANAAAPYLAAEIGEYFKKDGNENQTLQNLSHAVLGAALAYANGGNAAGGALAGGGGELAAQVLTKELYPQAFDENGVLQRDNLTPEQANNVLALSSAIGALLSGTNGGSMLDAAIGGQVASNAVENNALKNPSKVTTLEFPEYRRRTLDQVAECSNLTQCKSVESKLRSEASEFLRIAKNLDQQGDKARAAELWAMANSSIEAAEVAAGKSHTIVREYNLLRVGDLPQAKKDLAQTKKDVPQSGYVELDRSAGQHRDGVTGAAVGWTPPSAVTAWSSALIESDQGTKDYRARQAYETERALNILTLPMGVLARGYALVAGAEELWVTARTMNSVADATRAARASTEAVDAMFGLPKIGSEAKAAEAVMGFNSAKSEVTLGGTMSKSTVAQGDLVAGTSLDFNIAGSNSKMPWRPGVQSWEVPAVTTTNEVKAGVSVGNASTASVDQTIASSVSPKPVPSFVQEAGIAKSAPSTVDAIASAANANRAIPVELTFDDLGRSVIPQGALDAKLVANGTSDVQTGKIGTNASSLPSQVAGGESALPSTNSGRPLIVDSVESSASEAVIVSQTEARIQELIDQGHGVQRHGPAVSGQQLKERAVEGLDPMTGTTVDGVHGGEHQYARHATKVKTNEAYVFAEDYARRSQQFIDVTSASTTGRAQVEIPLRDMFGDDFRDFVTGVTRYGPKNAPLGSGNTIFGKDSYMIIRYKQDAKGSWEFNTMFPEPKE